MPRKIHAPPWETLNPRPSSMLLLQPWSLIHVVMTPVIPISVARGPNILPLATPHQMRPAMMTPASTKMSVLARYSSSSLHQV